MHSTKPDPYHSFSKEELLPLQQKSTYITNSYQAHWTGIYCFGAFFFLLNLILGFRQYQHTSLRFSPVVGLVNATLEFGAIYAVSRQDSARRPVLERAAGLAGLEIKIPRQPIWTDADVEGVVAQENSTLGRGSALAWLGHLNALKREALMYNLINVHTNLLFRFLDSSHETALIIEDDVDFDTHIRKDQIPVVAYAVRELLGSQNGLDYYGNTTMWDILWLGHCGDSFSAEQAAQILPIKTFIDTTLPLLKNLHPWTQNFLRGLGANEDQTRLVHKSVNPLCTFAYAVTRHAAERLVNDFAAREPSRPVDRPCSAFDVRMLEACRDAGFRCITVTPELFHHSATPSEIIAVESESPQESSEQMEEQDTPNIGCSARSELWWDSRRRPYNTPQIKARHSTMSDLAQKSGYCYLDQFR